MRLKCGAKFKGKLTCDLKNFLGPCLIFMQAVESLEICTLMGFFCLKEIKIEKYRRVMSYNTEEWCKV